MKTIWILMWVAWGLHTAPPYKKIDNHAEIFDARENALNRYEQLYEKQNETEKKQWTFYLFSSTICYVLSPSYKKFEPKRSSVESQISPANETFPKHIHCGAPMIRVYRNKWKCKVSDIDFTYNDDIEVDD